MSPRLDRRAYYRVAGEEGPWRYAGQATYDDQYGQRVEHDWVHMVQGDDLVAVPVTDVERIEAVITIEGAA